MGRSLFPSLAIILVFLLRQCAATHKVMEHTISHKIPHVKKLNRAPQEHIHEVIFAVKQRNLVELEKIVYEVSDPDSPKYGQHLSKEAVRKMTENPSASNKVKQYLHSIGARIVDEALSAEYIIAEAPLKIWEREFQTEFHHYEQHNEKTLEIIRSEKYSIPIALADHVETVFNTVQFMPVQSRMSHRKKVPEDFVHSHSPQELKAAKHTGSVISSAYSNPYSPFASPALLDHVYNIKHHNGNNLTTQGIYETGEALNPVDLIRFQQYFGLPDDKLALDIGGYVDPRACRGGQGYYTYYSGEYYFPDDVDCGEANLDGQYIMAMGQSVPTIYYSWNIAEWMLQWIMNLLKSHDIADVISISFGGPELYYSQSYIDAFNTEAMKLAAMGVTILIASGDDGAPNYIVRGESNLCGYHADFPSVSPYVTSVGATMGPEIDQPEVACQSNKGGVISSGGGFAESVDAPAFQQDALNAYFAYIQSHPSANPVPGYNKLGRGFPDISVLGAHFLMHDRGELTVASGTSFSAPIFAGMVSLINAQRRKVGASRVGWLNPALYSRANLFVRDITIGDNKCVAGNATDYVVCCDQGYYATTGWDPVTGLGTLDFAKFYTAFKAEDGTSSTSSSSTSDALTQGALAGVIIGCILGFTLLLSLGLAYSLRKSKRFTGVFPSVTTSHAKVAVEDPFAPPRYTGSKAGARIQENGFSDVIVNTNMMEAPPHNYQAQSQKQQQYQTRELESGLSPSTFPAPAASVVIEQPLPQAAYYPVMDPEPAAAASAPLIVAPPEESAMV